MTGFRKRDPLLRKAPEDMPISRKDAANVALIASRQENEAWVHVARWSMMLALVDFVLITAAFVWLWVK